MGRVRQDSVHPCAVSLGLLFHTVRALKGRQIVGQVRERVRRVLEDPARFRAREAPPFPGCRWQPRTPFPAPGGDPADAASLRTGRFRFLNRAVDLGWPPRWDAAEAPRLWRYNLHYFEYVFGLDLPDARQLVLDWIARHDLARGREGWEPYPTSLRLQNWCAYFFERHREAVLLDAELREALWRSIHTQAEWLAAHQETHLLGNHLFENGAALALCGACFEGEDGARWGRAGRDVLRSELPEQVLADGGHFERSPMYHARVAYALASLANTGDRELRALVDETLGRMLDALEELRHPDGEIALLNDSAFGIVLPPAELIAFARRARGEPAPGRPSSGAWSLPDTGYHGARSGAGDYVICDAAPIGPDYLPGHAHADLLAFELSFSGRRAIVDAGVHGYEPDALRAYCRSTRAHNTVEIEGSDQCELWAVFRVGRRGRPRDVRFERAQGGFRLFAWHDGYERLAGRPRHERTFRWHDAGVLLVRDRVRAGREVATASRLHLHPDCAVAERGARAAVVRHPGGLFRVEFAGPGTLEIERSSFCPRFGVERESAALVFSARGDDLAFGFAVARDARDLDFDLDSGARAGGREYSW